MGKRKFKKVSPAILITLGLAGIGLIYLARKKNAEAVVEAFEEVELPSEEV